MNDSEGLTMENAEKTTAAEVKDSAEVKNSEKDLEFYVKLFAENYVVQKTLEETQKKLKDAIIQKMDVLKLKKFSANVNDENADTVSSATVQLIENTKCTFDMDKIKAIVPQAIESTLTVDSSNMDEFKALLKSYNLTGKQVNALVKVMKIKKSVNVKTIDKLHDKGEITSEQLSDATSIDVTSRYIKFVKSK